MTSSTEATSTTPQVAVNDIGSEEAFLAAIDETIKYFNDGDIVEGTVVKVDRDEVLLDIGYKTEGVIPSRELSIKHDVDPERGRLRRRPRRGPRPPEGGQGRPADPVQEARAVRARLGHDREDQGRGRHRHRYRHRGRQGRAHPGHRPARLPARVAGRDAPRPRPAAVRRPRARGQDHRAGQEPQQRGPVPPRLAGADAERGPPDLPQHAAEGPGPQGRRVLDRQLRRVRRPRRGRRPGARLRAVLEAHRPPLRGRRGRPGGHRRGPRRRHGARAGLAVAQGDAGGPVAAVRPHPPDRPGRARAASPSWCRSARSSASRRASRAWCTSPSWPSATWRSPSRSSRSATRSSSRSSTSTSTGAGSACRSSRPTRAPSAIDEEDFDPTLYGMAAEYDDAGQLHLPRGLRPRDRRVAATATTSSARTWERQYAEARARFEAHRGRSRRPARPRPRPVPRPRGGDDAPTRAAARARPAAAPSPPTRRSRRCARSCPAGSQNVPSSGGPVRCDPRPDRRRTGTRCDRPRRRRPPRVVPPLRGGRRRLEKRTRPRPENDLARSASGRASVASP